MTFAYLSVCVLVFACMHELLRDWHDVKGNTLDFISEENEYDHPYMGL